MKDRFTEAELRDRVYARHVTDNMGLVRQFNAPAYERWSRNTHRQIAASLPDNRTAPILDAVAKLAIFSTC